MKAETFRIGRNTYRAQPIGPADARQMCRLLLGAAPHLRVMVPLTKAAPEGVAWVEELGRALNKLSEADQVWIGSTCLTSTERRVGLRWRPVWNAARRRVLFRDMPEIETFMLIVRVLHQVAAEYLNESVSA